MENQFKPLSEGEVLSVSESAQFLIGHGTFRVGELADTLREKLLEHSLGGLSKDTIGWFAEEGIPCEVLQFGAERWQPGTVRIHLEFCPSAPGSPSPTVDTPKPVEAVAAAPVSKPEETQELLEDSSEDIGFATDDLLMEDADESLALPEDEMDSPDDLFADSTEESGEMFGEEDSGADDLFGDGDAGLDLSADAEDSSDDLFGEGGDESGDDLFGDGDAGLDLSADTEDSSDDLFGDGGDESGDNLFGDGDAGLGDDLFGDSDDDLDLGDLGQSEELSLDGLSDNNSQTDSSEDVFDDIWQDIN